MYVLYTINIKYILSNILGFIFKRDYYINGIVFMNLNLMKATVTHIEYSPSKEVTFLHCKPESIYNKKRFQEYLEIEPTEKVKNIYTYGDFLGADYKVLISFTTDRETIATIVKIKNMNLSEVETDDGLGFTEEIPWGDRDKIESLQPYKIGKEDEYWKYLWYDTKTNQAFYEEFSL
jgi:hypothetical protein